MEINTQKVPVDPGRNTRPIEKVSHFEHRPRGAIFGNNYFFDQLLFTNETQHHYSVIQIGEKHQKFRVCPNPKCRAILSPKQDTLKYCTDCGIQLQDDLPKLMLIETTVPLYSEIGEVVDKQLSHGSVRAPIAFFNEDVCHEARYCIVTPFVTVLDRQPEAQQVLEWGPDLAFGLHFLHNNGIAFQGRIDANRFRLENGKPVWADFNGCTSNNNIPDSIKREDVQALVGQLYFWLSGKSQYEHDPIYPDGINLVFKNGLTPPGYTSGKDLAEAFIQAIQAAKTSSNVNYYSGRRTDVGITRTLNEDSLFTVETSRVIKSISSPLGIYIVADGMGGHAAGEVASSTIVNSFAELSFRDLLQTSLKGDEPVNYSNWLKEAVQTANKNVLDIRKSTGSDLGSTFVGALVDNNNAYIAHVGDSRAYLITSNKIQQITTDHSLVERLVATGQITAEEARYHPQRNVIYRTIGDKANIEVDMNTLTLNEGDILLLCSDGLSGMVTDEDMMRIIKNAPSPQAACDRLIDAANAAGGEDNITVVIIEMRSM